MGRVADCSHANRMGSGAEEFYLLRVPQGGSEDAGARVDGKIFRLRRCWDLFCGYQLLIVVLVDSKIMASCGNGFTCSSCDLWIAFWSRKERSTNHTKHTKYVSDGNLKRALITLLLVSLTCFLLASEATAHPAWGIAVDRQGQVYFSDLKTVWRIDTQGKVSVFRDEGHTHDLNVDEAGNVYGEHDFTAIWKMTPTGGFSYLYAPTGNPPRGVSIWTDRDGNMYSVEQNNHLKRETLLLRRTSGGNVSVLAGGSYGHADG